MVFSARAGVTFDTVANTTTPIKLGTDGSIPFEIIESFGQRPSQDADNPGNVLFMCAGKANGLLAVQGILSFSPDPSPRITAVAENDRGDMLLQHADFMADHQSYRGGMVAFTTEKGPDVHSLWRWLPGDLKLMPSHVGNAFGEGVQDTVRGLPSIDNVNNNLCLYFVLGGNDVVHPSVYEACGSGDAVALPGTGYMSMGEVQADQGQFVTCTKGAGAAIYLYTPEQRYPVANSVVGDPKFQTLLDDPDNNNPGFRDKVVSFRAAGTSGEGIYFRNVSNPPMLGDVQIAADSSTPIPESSPPMNFNFFSDQTCISQRRIAFIGGRRASDGTVQMKGIYVYLMGPQPRVLKIVDLTMQLNFGAAGTFSQVKDLSIGHEALVGDKLVFWARSDDFGPGIFLAKGVSVVIADFTASPNPVFLGLPVTFKDMSWGAISSWTWDFGEGPPVVFNQASPTYTHRYAHSGSKMVKLTVTGPGGAMDLVGMTVTVNSWPNPPPPRCPRPIANFVATIDPHGLLPVVTFRDTSTGCITFWDWDFGDGNHMMYSTYRTQVTHPYSKAGRWTPSLTVSDLGISSTKTGQSISVTRLKNPAP